MDKRWLLVAALAVLSTLSSQASAAYMTTNATFYALDTNGSLNPGANPPVIQIVELGFSAGQIWTNQVTSPAGPFGAGGTVRTVGAIGLGNMRNGNVTPVATPDGSSIHVVFAVEGTILSPGTASFSKGSLYFIASDTDNIPGGFDPGNPLSFNFDDAFAKFDLAPPMAVVDGFATAGVHSSSAEIFAASSANKSTVDLFGETGAGFFVVQEDTAFVPGALFSNPGLGVNVGDDWMSDLEANTLGFEGQSLVTDQSVDGTPMIPSAAQLAVLNAISTAALGSAFSGLVGDTTFDPKGKSSATPTGDFSASFSLDSAPITLVAVPEPTSLCVFGLAFLAISGFRQRRS